jgi:hypothetical protein
MRNKTVACATLESVLVYLQGVLKKRLRHGYMLREKSEIFPSLAVLEDVPVIPPRRGEQMRLFS